MTLDVRDDEIRITLVRHGESVANSARRWQGQGESPLSERGCAQAVALAERLAARRFDRIVASDLERASATARALDRPFVRDAGFRECDVGAWEGLTRAQVVARFADQLARLEAGEDVAPGGGESYRAFTARVDAALARLRAALAPGQCALVICHGGVIGALVAGVLGLRGARDLPLASLRNASMTELVYARDGRASLCVFNDALHLAAVSASPQSDVAPSALGLVCETAPHGCFGAYRAHYDLAASTDLLAGTSVEALSLAALWGHVQQRHPVSRVALSARAERILAWVGDALWRATPVSSDPRVAALTSPASGVVCHLSAFEGRLTLLDYGVSPR